MKRLLLILLLAAAAHGDSGLIRLSETVFPWQVTVMTDPTPIREGLVDISVLIQDAKSDAAILDATVMLELKHVQSGLTVSTEATRQQAVNRLLYAAKFVVPAAGQWTVETHIEHGDDAQVIAWSFTAATPLPPLAVIWPWLLPAVLAIAVYAANQRLRQSRGAAQRDQPNEH
jgi:hypothetical protein